MKLKIIGTVFCTLILAGIFVPVASSEEQGAALDIEISGGFKTKMAIRNVGDTDALLVYWNASISGGFIKKINASYTGFIGSLPPHGDMIDLVITFPSDQLTGFGKVTITGTVDSLLTSPVVEEVDGFLFFFYMIILN
jgi:hypothetical protein